MTNPARTELEAIAAEQEADELASRPSRAVAHYENYSDDAAQLLAALEELVACKDIHDAIESEPQPFDSSSGWLEMNEDYERRKPIAWARARDLVAKLRSQSA